jgi:multidrug resistance efflux pump
MAGWMTWFFGGAVEVTRSSSISHVETEEPPHVLAAATDGVVRSNKIVLGQRVKRGEPLVELDPTQVLAVLRTAEAQLEVALQSQRSLAEEVRLMQRAETSVESKARVERDAARGVLSQVRQVESLSLDLAASQRRLSEANLASKRDLVEQERDLAQKRALVMEAAGNERRAEANLSLTLINKSLAPLDVQRRLAAAEGSVVSAEQSVAKLRSELERQVVWAPIDGVIAEVERVTTGDYAPAGRRFGAVVASTRYIVSAEFNAREAIGLLTPGQQAAFRPDTGPMRQVYSIPLTVHRVANEPKDGTFRVELSIDGDHESLLSYGETGQAEVAVARMSPFNFALRSGSDMFARVKGRP